MALRNQTNDVERGVFEKVESSKVQDVVNALQKQEILTVFNLEKNISLGEKAWRIAGATGKEQTDCGYEKENQSESTKHYAIQGIGEGFEEDDGEPVVFNSDKKVSDLANDALRKWVATFLLGAPALASS